jgi:hypothetical protein
MSVAEAIEEALSAGRDLDILALGGLAAFVAERETLAASPFLDVLAQLAVSASPQSVEAMDALVLRGFEVSLHPSAFRDAIEILVGDETLLIRLAPSLFRVLERRVEEEREGSVPLLAAYALEGLFRFALAGRISKHRPLALMAEVKPQQADIFVEHAAKLVGAAYGVWGDAELIATLERLATHEAAAGEACFELGLARLQEALDRPSLDQALEGFEVADLLFRTAIEANEERADAVAYSAVISIIRMFSAGEVGERLAAPLKVLELAVADRAGLLRIGKQASWLAPRTDRETSWVQMLRKVRRLADALEKPSWIKAASVMSEVLEVYDADRTVATGTGFENLVHPRIVAAFVRERGLLAHLDDLLGDETWTEGRRDAAHELRLCIDNVSRGLAPEKPGGEGSYPCLESLLPLHPPFSRDMTLLLEKTEAVLASVGARRSLLTNPVLQRTFQAIQDGLVDCADYVGAVRDDFNDLARQVLLFCKDRQDAGLKAMGPRGEYLRSLTATEFDLQSDLRQWLVGNYWLGEVMTEVEDVSTGRADIYVTMGSYRFVIELKLSFSAVDPISARAFTTQAGAYQNTNVKLGMLGVLEIINRTRFADAIDECLWIDTLPSSSTLATARRHLLVFKVPGALATPSSFSKASRKPRNLSR